MNRAKEDPGRAPHIVLVINHEAGFVVDLGCSSKWVSAGVEDRRSGSDD